MIEISGYCVSLGETQVQIAKIEERKGLKRKIAPLAKVIFFAVFRIIELWSVDYKFQRLLEGKRMKIKKSSGCKQVSFLG